ncbi:MAG: hypothetical protein ACRCT8_16050 [Lacipirellulaceae bacterium]
MIDLVNHWLGRPVSRLDRRLRDYPPYRVPHPGYGTDLTDEQAEANLDYLLGARAGRVTALAGLLLEEGIDLLRGMANPDPGPVLNEIEEWAQATWYRLARWKKGKRTDWGPTSREGDDIAYSMTMDLAIVLGELIMAARPEFHWALDRDPENAEMYTYNRPVLFRPDDVRLNRGRTLFDLDEKTFVTFIQSTRWTIRMHYNFKRFVCGVIAGEYDGPICK